MLTYKVAILGSPIQPNIAWTGENVDRLKAHGFNTLQLNLAWGYRPADEPLNLEDVVELPPDRKEQLSQSVPLRSDPSRFQVRREQLKERIKLCREKGVRSIFHFGAPFNAHNTYGDAPPNCLMDEATPERHVQLIRLFAEQFPGVDDLLLYTYDQDAWLCSEFGPCTRCRGLPLHQRVTSFVNLLARTWQELQPDGRVWWEPWELSAGQVLKSVDLLDASCIGLALHSNIAEAMTTLPVDRWLKLTRRLAEAAGIPVIVEHFLSGPSEEVEPFEHLAHPHALLRALRAILAIAPDGIKEYYGLNPEAEDPNLRMTGILLNDPGLSDEEILARTAAPFQDQAGSILEVWRLGSEAMELFPWNCSWWIRSIGNCNPNHAMTAAYIRGQQAHTPSWESSRRSIFMKTDDLQPDPWMLEDLQLQCELAADRMSQALILGANIQPALTGRLADAFAATLEDLRQFRRRVLSYAYHVRETNLAAMMRLSREQGTEIDSKWKEELLAVLRADQKNQDDLEPCDAAICMLQKDTDEFLRTYFLVPNPKESNLNTGAPETLTARGAFTVTSRR